MNDPLTPGQMPGWLVVLAEVSLCLGGASALWIVLDLLTDHRQPMWIMSVVWPMTALWAGPLAIYAYYRVGRLSTHHRVQEAQPRR